MLKKKMAAGIVALAMFSTLGLAACDSGGSERWRWIRLRFHPSTRRRL